MRRRMIITALSLVLAEVAQAQREPVRTYVDEPIVGWHWYNEPVEKEEEEQGEPTVSLTSLPPSVQMKVLQRVTADRLNNAILYPTVENFTAYMKMQNYWTTQAGRFSAVAAKSMLAHPELDYNLRYSHYNSTVPLQMKAEQGLQEAALRELTAKYGLFYFYRGNNALDVQMAKVVSQVAQQYGVALVAVSMDGARAPELPDTRPDSGQAQRLGITHLPALFLVDPGAEDYRPMSYGFMTQDDLMKRFLNVARDFAPRS
ncbi:type-F conjugative transfer system pilin assembly protein TraF [Salmonella enterica]|nr:type-F conjugative transfer system pilin assembly protein TraF [Salmonella enterica]EBX9174525.1 type-F conjugative transfer system pilin assembly protein TraF [Salmonella enterica subsp. enterica serovar Kandla]EBP0846467.1 type-F conjugative transfer system pilin assembly protein TraF [Salmonella enterica]EBX9805282.1 type-F conjugative transfer system pilin assembly protein TraF [Salmonella enterica subsp. enterica serovar Kandla]EBY1906753.1 type-F conjugative transfer system pilin assem